MLSSNPLQLRQLCAFSQASASPVSLLLTEHRKAANLACLVSSASTIEIASNTSRQHLLRAASTASFPFPRTRLLHRISLMPFAT